MLRRALVPVACLLAAFAAAPGVARASVPHGWLGVVADGPLFESARGVSLEREVALMGRSGSGAVRFAIYWADLQPFAAWADVPAGREASFSDVGGRPFDFTATDRVVGAIARAGMHPRPYVLEAPRWARRENSDPASPPRDEADYGRALAVLAQRYGPGGTFWVGQPAAQAVPIRRWQIWNEPNMQRFWSARPWAASYVRLLRAARVAVRGVDPGALIVVGGLTNRSWEHLQSIYSAGGRGLFDLAALHPFTARPRDVLRIVGRARKIMGRNNDSRRSIVISELTWSSARNRAPVRFGWESTEKGQAARLTIAIRLLAAHRLRLRIAGVTWYTWLSPLPGARDTFSYSGLRRRSLRGVVTKPALRSFRRVARHLAPR